MSVADEALGEPQPRQLIVSVYGLYARDARRVAPGRRAGPAAGGAGGRAAGGAVVDLPAQAPGHPAQPAPGRRRRVRAGAVDGRDPARGRPADLRAPARHAGRRLGAGRVHGAGDAAGQAARAAQPAGRPRLRADGARCLGRSRDAGRRGAGRAGPAGPDRLRRPLPWRVPGGRPARLRAPGRSRARVVGPPRHRGPVCRVRRRPPAAGEAVARRPPSPGEAFAAYVRMLTVWRRLRYLDPGLPLELLPPRWKGVAAAELFAELDRGAAPAGRPARPRGARRGLHPAQAVAGSSAVPCTSTSASSSHSRATPMPAVAG